MRSLTLCLLFLVAASVPAAAVPHTFSLDVSGWEEKPRTVAVAGDFNQWSADADPMSPDGGAPNRWSTTVDLPPGLTRYKFVIDGVRVDRGPRRGPDRARRVRRQQRGGGGRRRGGARRVDAPLRRRHQRLGRPAGLHGGRGLLQRLEQDRHADDRAGAGGLRRRGPAARRRSLLQVRRRRRALGHRRGRRRSGAGGARRPRRDQLRGGGRLRRPSAARPQAGSPQPRGDAAPPRRLHPPQRRLAGAGAAGGGPAGGRRRARARPHPHRRP